MFSNTARIVVLAIFEHFYLFNFMIFVVHLLGIVMEIVVKELRKNRRRIVNS